MPHILKQSNSNKKQQQSAHAINTTPYKLVLIVLANKFIKLANKYVVIISHPNLNLNNKRFNFPFSIMVSILKQGLRFRVGAAGLVNGH
jgi:hypothetical protein